WNSALSLVIVAVNLAIPALGSKNASVSMIAILLTGRFTGAAGELVGGADCVAGAVGVGVGFAPGVAGRCARTAPALKTSTRALLESSVFLFMVSGDWGIDFVEAPSTLYETRVTL